MLKRIGIVALLLSVGGGVYFIQSVNGPKPGAVKFAFLADFDGSYDDFVTRLIEDASPEQSVRRRCAHDVRPQGAGALWIHRRHQPAGVGLGRPPEHLERPARLYQPGCAGRVCSGISERIRQVHGAPTARSQHEGADTLLCAEDDPGKRDFGRNGTYLVLRQLKQDVGGFWSFVNRRNVSRPNGKALAEAMVGRRLDDGAPLVRPSAHAIERRTAEADEPENRFTCKEDGEGSRCPFGAHIRRANPHNADFPRRPFGIALPDESDPLLGAEDGGFSIPREGKCPARVTGIPRFIAVRGGAYFFLPGIREIRYFARAAN